MPEPLAQLAEDFERFRDEAAELFVLINTFEALYGDEANHAALESVAGLFFGNLHQWLIELYALKVARLTDPAATRTRNGERKNLTARYLIEQAEELIPKVADKPEFVRATDLLARLETYAAGLRAARNRTVAHLDLAHARSGDSIGAHTREAYEQFQTDLQLFSYDIAALVGAQPDDFGCSAGPGDAVDLLRALAETGRGKANHLGKS